MLVPNEDHSSNDQAHLDYKNGAWHAKAKQLTKQYARLKWTVNDDEQS